MRPPTPSMTEWWTFMTRAAESASTPSTSTASQSGNAGSNPLVAIVCARSRTARSPPWSGRRMRRRWTSRSKVSSGTNWGRPRPGRLTARDRRRGTDSVNEAMRARTSAQSGVESSTSSATMVGRMTGSALIVHSKASDPLMVSTPLVVSVSAITDPLTGDSATIPGGL